MPEQKPTKAVALRYDSEKEASPRVVASGHGKVAERIAELAREAGVPTKSDPSLVEVLVKLDLATLVPEELYQVLAELFAWAYRQDRQLTAETPPAS